MNNRESLCDSNQNLLSSEITSPIGSNKILSLESHQNHNLKSPFFYDNINWQNLSQHILKNHSDKIAKHDTIINQYGSLNKSINKPNDRNNQAKVTKRRRKTSVGPDIRLLSENGSMQPEYTRESIFSSSCYCRDCGSKISKRHLCFKSYNQNVLQSPTLGNNKKTIFSTRSTLKNSQKSNKNIILLSSLLPKIKRRDNVCLPVDFQPEINGQRRVESIRLQGQMKIFHRFLLGLVQKPGMGEHSPNQFGFRTPKTPKSNTPKSKVEDINNDGQSQDHLSKQGSFSRRAGAMQKSLFSTFQRQQTKQMTIITQIIPVNKDRKVGNSLYIPKINPILQRSKNDEIESQRIKTEVTKTSSLTPLNDFLRSRIVIRKKEDKVSTMEPSKIEQTNKRILSLYSKKQNWHYLGKEKKCSNNQKSKLSLGECHSERVKLGSSNWSVYHK